LTRHQERLGKLELHPDKTRLIGFGRFAAGNRRGRGARNLMASICPGFASSCSATGSKLRRHKLLGRTIEKRFRSKIADICKSLRIRINCSIIRVGEMT
jgi:hypothetical protein